MGHEGQKRLLCFLNFSERSLGAATSRLTLRFISEGYICAINPLYHLAMISKFSVLLITYLESVEPRNLSALRSNLEMCPYSRGDPGVKPTAVHDCSTGPGLSTIYKV